MMKANGTPLKITTRLEFFTPPQGPCVCVCVCVGGGGGIVLMHAPLVCKQVNKVG